jgi:hypothetical protein
MPTIEIKEKKGQQWVSLTPITYPEIKERAKEMWGKDICIKLDTGSLTTYFCGTEKIANDMIRAKKGVIIVRLDQAGEGIDQILEQATEAIAVFDTIEKAQAIFPDPPHESIAATQKDPRVWW